MNDSERLTPLVLRRLNKPKQKLDVSITKAKALLPREQRALNHQLTGEGKRRCEACGLLYRLHVDNFPRRGKGELRYICRRCYNTQMRERYASNSEVRAKMNANSSKNYYQNHAQRLQQQADYRAAHRPYIRSYARCYYASHRRTILRDRRQSRPQQAVSMREYRRRWKREQFARVLAGGTP